MKIDKLMLHYYELVINRTELPQNLHNYNKDLPKSTSAKTEPDKECSKRLKTDWTQKCWNQPSTIVAS